MTSKMNTTTLQQLMRNQDNIRNISIIAHVDHGKTALTESLTHVHMDVGEEKERGITIKSAAVSIELSRQEYDAKHDKESEQSYLINLIDSPGHIDFSSEVTAALRITDGAICVIDCIEGGKTQTETVLRQAILELVKPTLFLNKVDRIWLEKQLSPMEAYRTFRNSIEWTNAICQTYNDQTLGDIEMKPSKNNVAFGSGYFGWGFTIDDFAEIYYGVGPPGTIGKKEMTKKLWKSRKFVGSSRQWVKTKGSQEENAFCTYVLKPLQVLHEAVMDDKRDVYVPIIQALRLGITTNDLNNCKSNKERLKLIMSTWLPAKDAVLKLCADSLPSPVTAQRYRIPHLYTGPLESQEAQQMRMCKVGKDTNLSMYISKMVAVEKDPGRFIAFGRVFSGTVSRGQDLRILNSSNSEQEESKGAETKKVQGIVVLKGSKQMSLNECPAGNICGLMGIDKSLVKSGTLSNSDSVYPFKTMKFSVSPVVKVAVKATNQRNLSKLIQGLQRLSQYDNIVTITQNKQKQHIIAGSGELHLQTCLNTLKEKFLGASVEIETSPPIVSYCEGIRTNSTNPSTQAAMVIISKSANKLNRIYMTCEPLSDEVCDALEKDQISLRSDMKAFSRDFVQRFPHWEKSDAQSIWSLGCAPYGKCNMLVDQTKAVDYLDKVKSSIIEGFRQITDGSILCDEPLRGVRFNLVDAKIHADPSHHGAGQIIGAAVRACYGCVLSAQPCLFEPMYELNVECPSDSQNGVFNTFGKCRAEFLKMDHREATGMVQMKAYIPIAETLKNADNKRNKLGFTELLRANTQGKAFVTTKFSHWKRVDGDVTKSTSSVHKIVMDIRKRKKRMKLEIPSLNDFHDRI